MGKRLKKRNGQPLVVACSMDFDRDEYLVRQAGRLAQQLSAPLHLVHSLEPYKYHHWLNAGSEAGDYPEGTGMPTGNIFRTALSGLNVLADMIRAQFPTCEITANVLSGPPADAISTEAEAIDALLVIVGSADETRILAGLSTTRELLTSCHVPVLIINDDCSTDFTKDQLSVLIADGLHDGALQPLRTAASLAARSGRARLIHAHVKNGRQKLFQRWFLDPFARLMHRSADSGFPGESTTRLLARIKERAAKAGAKSVDEPETYVPILVEGDPEKMLHDLADEYSADIIVFGKHKLLHLENMTLGSLSTSGMLSHKSAVMVVPA